MRPSDPISFSIMIDTKAPVRSPEILGVQARSLDAWSDDSTVNECYECKTPFTFSRWKHHCRLCGRVFCYACSSRSAIIPFYITKVPIPSDNHQNEDRTKPLRVCDPCYDRLKNLENIANHVKITRPSPSGSPLHCGFMSPSGSTCNTESENDCLDIEHLHRLADAKHTADSLMRQWANFKLSTFREIQYFMPGHEFSAEECAMLWTNRWHFIGHKIWFMQLLRSINFHTAPPAVLEEVDDLLTEFQRHVKNAETQPDKICDNGGENEIRGYESVHTACWTLMCSRRCDATFSVRDAVQLLNRQICYNPVRGFALGFMDNCTENELKLWVPYLVRHSLYAPLVSQWLISKCAESELIANETFWEYQNYLDFTRPQIISRGSEIGSGHMVSLRSGRPSHLHEIMQESFAQWKQSVPTAVQEKIMNGLEFMQVIRRGYHGPDGPDGVAKSFAAMQKNSYYLPTNVSRHGRVDYRKVSVMGSCTAPVTLPIIPGIPTEERSEDTNTTFVAPHLYKPADVRKEQIIMNTIRLFKLVLLQDEGLDLPIVDFDIRPTSNHDGLVQMVPNCISLEELRASRTDILPWIIEQNEDSKETAAELRERFLQSCAAYCVISYLLGIGDRNLHNLLLRPDGSLFHIDFGFVLGQDPKPLEKPQMRITSEMLAALGGTESQAYKRFRELSSRIYNCIRRHVNVFVVMLQMLVESTPVIEENGIISEEQLMKEIRRRFAPGESVKEAEILLYNHIEQSTTRTFTYAVIDKAHTWATSSSSAMTSAMFSTVPSSLIIFGGNPRPGHASAGRRASGGGYGLRSTANNVLKTIWYVTGLNSNDQNYVEKDSSISSENDIVAKNEEIKS